jgi:SAM-dependent methyltransferase
MTAGQRPWTLETTTTTPIDLLLHGHGNRVLEVGCGSGIEADQIANAGFQVRGIDVDPETIAAASARFGGRGPDFVVEDFLDHRYADEFDVVYERGVLHNIKSMRARQLFARRVARALRQSGRWVSVSGAADDISARRAHGCLYLTHIISAVEPYFLVRSVERRAYGRIQEGFDFEAWYCVFERRS